MDCKECKVERQTVPYIVHEGMMARQERTIKRLWIALLLVIVLLAGSNLAWIVYESQYEEVTTTETYEATTDGGGTAVANGSGDVKGLGGIGWKGFADKVGEIYGESAVHEND